MRTEIKTRPIGERFEYKGETLEVMVIVFTMLQPAVAAGMKGKME